MDSTTTTHIQDTRLRIGVNTFEQKLFFLTRRLQQPTGTMSNQHPAPEDDASSAYDDEEDEDGSSEGGEEEVGGPLADY